MGRICIYTPEKVHARKLDNQKRYRDKNKAKDSIYKAQYYKDNKHKINKDAAKIIRKRTYKRNRLDEIEKAKIRSKKPKSRFCEVRYGAKRRNIEFNLTFKQFINLWEKPCYYCNSQISGIGIDRVNNSEGYTIDNIVSCCKVCNWMKRHLTVENFVDHCDKVVKFKQERS